MSDHQTRITTQMGGTFQALDGVRARIDAIERSTKRANSAAKDHQATLSKGLSAGRGGAMAAQKFGGQGGAFAGQVAAGAGMDGVFGKLAVGAAVVGFAFRALGSVIESRMAQERTVIEMTGKLRDGLASAAKNAAQSAVTGLGQADVTRTLIGRGGSLKDARGIADELGISDEDAAKGLSDALTEFGAMQRGIIEAAKLAVGTGQIGFADAVKGLKSKEGRGARNLAGDGRTGEAAARIVGAHIGDPRFTAAQVAYYSDNLSRGGITDRFTEATGIKNDIGRNQLERVRRGEATGALRGQLSEERAPQATAMLQWNRALADSIAQMEQLAKAQGRFASILADAGMLIGGDGSKETQARRLKLAGERALSSREQ